MVDGLIGVKRGMTQLFDGQNMFVPVTVLEVGPCRVLHIKTKEKDGYEGVQIGFSEITRKRIRRDVAERFKKLDLVPLKHLKEFKPVKSGEFPELTSELTVEVFDGVKTVDIQGHCKGRGFQGVMRRYSFGGGPGGHGSHFHRAPGSIGACAYPAETPKGRKMPGRMAARNVTTKHLTVVRVDVERNLLFVRGAVPGPKNGLVYVYKGK